ncbi:MAG: LON peptidase substrate-binding domain-containing protein [Rhizobiales bacterium]|jgi:Lon protease-like protein|nr:LON peptidase substrate-binding domain-containing protein [Hyphomicrobiales bacterium]
MAINIAYRSPNEIPDVIPVFPLPRALLLPRAELPLNIFEPRYLQMIEDVIRGERLIGMIQPNEPEENATKTPPLYSIGCLGRLTSFSESGDGRYQVVLTGITRFRVIEEIDVTTPYRQCKVDYTIFGEDLVQGFGEDDVDREALLKTLANYLAANSIEADWSGITQAPTEALVNGLCLMSPFGVREKQALLEAPDLRARAQLLVAATEITLAAGETDENGTLQ